MKHIVFGILYKIAISDFKFVNFIMKISTTEITSVHHLRSVGRIFVHRSVKCAASQSI